MGNWKWEKIKYDKLDKKIDEKQLSITKQTCLVNARFFQLFFNALEMLVPAGLMKKNVDSGFLLFTEILFF